MKVQLINKAMFREMPWANGGGVTTELFAYLDPQSARILWRISMAGVCTDGPFSCFAGYDRILILTEGRGLTLRHGDGTEQKLAVIGEMAAFPGDIDTHATLVDGPVHDFNIIVDRTTFSPAAAVVHAGECNSVSVDADVLAFFALDDALRITDPGANNHHVPKGELLLVDAPQRGDWTLSGATTIVTQLSRRDVSPA